MSRTAEGPKGFLAAEATGFLLVMGYSILAPVLPLYAVRFGLSDTGVGVVVGAFGLGGLLSSLAGGMLADRFGPRRIAVLGCMVFALASFAAALVPSVTVLVACRVLQGAGAALYLTATLSLLLAVMPANRVSAAVARYQAAMLFAFSMGPMLGGALTRVFGPASVFVACGAFAVAGMAASRLLLPEVEGRRRDAHEAPLGWAPLLRGPLLTVLCATVAMFWARAGIRGTVVPLFAAAEFGYDEFGVGLLLTSAAIANVVALRTLGSRMDGAGRRSTLMLAVSGSACTVALFAFTGAGWMLYPFAIGLSIATGFATVTAVGVISDVAEPALRGRAIGLQRTANDLGMMVGPVTAGALSELLGYRRSFLAAAAVLTLVLLLARRMPETAATGAP